MYSDDRILSKEHKIDIYHLKNQKSEHFQKVETFEITNLRGLKREVRISFKDIYGEGRAKKVLQVFISTDQWKGTTSKTGKTGFDIVTRVG